MSDLNREIESVRPGFSAFIKANGAIDEYADGQVMAIRRMQLTDMTEERTRRIKMRRRTNVEVNGTIYGRGHKVRTNTIAHSPSGLNVQYTTPAGHPDPEALQRTFRNTVLDDQARLTRINNITTQFVTRDTYENYVGLFFSLFSLAWTIEHVDKNTTHRRRIPFGPEILEMPQPGEDPNTYWGRARAILRDQAGYAVEDFAQPLGGLGNGRLAQLRPDDRQRRHVMVDVWEVPSYDDGHTHINTQRFRTAGFVNQRYVCNNIVRTNPLPLDMLGGSVRNLPDANENDAAVFFGNRFFVRSEGFTDADFWITAMALYGRQRSTPFLCDQTVPLAGEDDRTIFIGHTNAEVQAALNRFTGVADPAHNPSLTVSFDDVMKTLNKIVSIHRCYDDLAIARDLFDNFVIQPDPSTVESHVYPNICWTTDLPRLGMRRAAIGPLLGGTPALITPKSLANARLHHPIRRLQTSISLLTNTLWFWGEYLQAAQHTHWDEAVYDLVGGKAHEMNVSRWQATVISAIIGQEQPTSIFEGVGTRFTQSFEPNFGHSTVRIDNIPQSRELDRTSDHIVLHLVQCRRFKYTVPPPNAAQIAGISGTLAMFTPYNSHFSVEKPKRLRARQRLISRTDRLNIWNIGVAGRWNGYDVWYGDDTTHDRAQHLVMYAANREQIPHPPVFDAEVDIVNQYTLFNIYERDNCFGDGPLDALETLGTRDFAWMNEATELKSRFNRRAADSAILGGRGPRNMVLFEQVEFDQEYVIAVRAAYDGEQADFRVEQVMAGVVPAPPLEAPQAPGEAGDAAMSDQEAEEQNELGE